MGFWAMLCRIMVTHNWKHMLSWPLASLLVLPMSMFLTFAVCWQHGFLTSFLIRENVETGSVDGMWALFSMYSMARFQTPGEKQILVELLGFVIKKKPIPLMVWLEGYDHKYDTTEPWLRAYPAKLMFLFGKTIFSFVVIRGWGSRFTVAVNKAS